MLALSVSFDLVAVVVTVIFQLILEYKHKNTILNCHMREMIPYARGVFFVTTLHFLMGIAFSDKLKALFILFYGSLFVLLVLQLIWPTDTNSFIAKKHEEMRKKREKNQSELFRSPWLLKTYEIGNILFYYLVMLFSLIVCVRIAYLLRVL